MPRRYILDDSESSASEFSETDVSFSSPHGRRRIKRQSFSRSRQRLSPDSNAYLNPNLVSSVRRSASTGNRRRRGDDREPMVVIDVNNDVRNRQDSRDRHDRYERTDRHDRHQRVVDYDDDDIEVLRPHRRVRAVSNSAPRTPSPRQQQQRDWETLMDQRILARNDIRQDLEITKQQQEIDRLERQLSRHKEKKRDRRESHSRHRFEDIYYEDDISEKMRKLERLEKIKRNEEEQRLAEVRAKVRRLEEMERKAEEEEEAKRLAHEKHLKEIEKRENIKAEKDRLKKELQDEEARKAFEEAERKKELAMLKTQAVEEWKRAEDAKRLKEIKEKEQKDQEYKERLMADFGYSEEQIEKKLMKEKKDEEKKGKDKDGKLVILEPEKTTFIKVKSIDPVEYSVVLTHAVGAQEMAIACNTRRLPPAMGLG